jgi:NitT/TauT family transport system substrate-binding protein
MYRSNGASPTRSVKVARLRAATFRRCASALLLSICLAAAGACASPNGKNSGGRQKIIISIGIAAPTSAPVYLADTLNYFKKQGLNVQVKIIPNAYMSLAAGQIQYGLVGVSQLIQAAQRNTGLQQICVTQMDPNYVLAVSQKTLGAKGITPSMSLKETLTRLKDEKVTEVGGPVNPGSILLASLLKQNGLPPDWIKVISQTSSSSATAAFAQGQVGVIFQPQPAPDQVLSRAPGRIVFNTRNSPIFANLQQAQWSGIAGSAKYIAAHPDISKKICTAIGQANNYLIDHTAEASKVLQGKMTAFQPKFLQEALTSYKWARDGKMSESQYRSGIKVLADYGIFKQPSDQVISKAYTAAYQQ